MSHPEIVDQRILEIIVRSPDCALEDLVLQCPRLTWNQVFIAIDRLSREGVLTLAPKERGVYTVRLSNEVRQEELHHALVESLFLSRGPLSHD